MIGFDMARHFFAVCVIIMHMNSSHFSHDANTLLRAIQAYLDGCVFGFFIISGIFTKFDGRFTDFFCTQMRRLLIPYFLFAWFYGLIFALLGETSILRAFIDAVRLESIAMQLYFLPLLFFSQLLGFFLMVFRQRAPYLNYIVIVILAFASVITDSDYSTGFHYNLLPMYGLSFFLGVSLSRFRNNLRKSKEMKIAILISLVIGFLDERFFDLAFAAVVVLLFSEITNLFGRKRLPGSGVVYLAHTPLVNFSIVIVLFRFGLEEELVLSFSIVLTYIFCCLCAYVVLKTLGPMKWLALE
ncbi:acyltransferase family protein [Roseibacillus ishigakijimensis]|uniref:Acyltransferase 3 domain-containing protein n=1 Tax=Roseibacillus ishigakijimensis TaxID=454146 RepID=A0A934RSY7_9BACT|nr:acyltransferase family protein [Roseibacillus ishigakijimensis]MBK1833640.1 hypothetical protein [Roseibacillus ishigakijimensis]